MTTEQFSLCWDNFHKNMSSGISSLLMTEHFVDVTLAIEGQYLKAHQMILSVCSPYFRTLFSMNPCKHPIVIIKDISYAVMKDLLTFMYQGQVQVNQENLVTFIKTAETLQIKGLTGNNKSADIVQEINSKRLAATEEPKSKTVRKQSIQNAMKKPKSDEMEINVQSPIDATVAISPEFVSTSTINDCVTLKIEPRDTIPEDEINNFDEEVEGGSLAQNMDEMAEIQAGTSRDEENTIHRIKAKRPPTEQPRPSKKQISTKKTKLSLPSDETILPNSADPSAVIKPEFISLTNDSVDLKMEPFDSSFEDEFNDNNFVDGQIDERLDGGKDYIVEEEETHAGTSADGMADGQVLSETHHPDYGAKSARGRGRAPKCTRKRNGDASLRLQALHWAHFPQHIPPTACRNKPTRACRVCTRNKKRSETTWECKQCKVALHVPNCFEKYHTIQDY